MRIRMSDEVELALLLKDAYAKFCKANTKSLFEMSDGEALKAFTYSTLCDCFVSSNSVLEAFIQCVNLTCVCRDDVWFYIVILAKLHEVDEGDNVDIDYESLKEEKE